MAACLAAGKDISGLVGTNLKELNGGNVRIGASDWFVLEACEYKRAFLNLNPEILVVTNLEAEHLDYFLNLDDYVSAFQELVKKISKSGTLIINSRNFKIKSKHSSDLKEICALAPNVIEAGLASNLNLQIPGKHNQRNAALALAVIKKIGGDLETAKKGLEKFTGGWRRFEYKGEFQGAPVYDDYAHHPTEIQATLAAAREKFPDKKIVAIYQQHQLDRATKMKTELGQSFNEAEIVLVPNIYQVRDESSQENITPEDFVTEIKKHGRTAYYTRNFSKTVTWLQENISEKNLVLIMGAGDIFRITEQLFT